MNQVQQSTQYASNVDQFSYDQNSSLPQIGDVDTPVPAYNNIQYNVQYNLPNYLPPPPEGFTYGLVQKDQQELKSKKVVKKPLKSKRQKSKTKGGRLQEDMLLKQLQQLGQINPSGYAISDSQTKANFTINPASLDKDYLVSSSRDENVIKINDSMVS